MQVQASNRAWKAADKDIRAQVVVENSAGHTYSIPVHASLTRPQVLSSQSLHFPLTQIGKDSQMSFTVQNPTRLALDVELVCDVLTVFLIVPWFVLCIRFCGLFLMSIRRRSAKLSRRFRR